MIPTGRAGTTDQGSTHLQHYQTICLSLIRNNLHWYKFIQRLLYPYITTVHFLCSVVQEGGQQGIKFVVKGDDVGDIGLQVGRNL